MADAIRTTSEDKSVVTGFGQPMRPPPGEIWSCQICGKPVPGEDDHSIASAALCSCAYTRAQRPCRTDKDYAIEFGRYLAASAERYQAAVNSYYSARDGDCDQTKVYAAAEMTEAYTRLSSDIHEFRKRAERANG